MLGALVVLTLSAAPGDDAQAALREAVALYHRLLLEQALEKLSRAKASSKGPDDDVPILLYEGLIDMDLGEVKSGAAAFRSALLLSPDVPLPEKASPKIAQQFEAIRGEVKAQLPRARPPAEPPKPVAPPPVQTAAEPAAAPELIAEPPPEHRGRPYSWHPLVGAAVLEIVAGICLGEAGAKHAQLVDTSAMPLGSSGAGVASAGSAFQTAGFVLLGAGVAALVLAAVLFFL